MIRENLTNRDRSRHVDVEVHYLRDLVRDGHVKLVKNVTRPDFEKDSEHLWGTRVPFSTFFSTLCVYYDG